MSKIMRWTCLDLSPVELVPVEQTELPAVVPPEESKLLFHYVVDYQYHLIK